MRAVVTSVTNNKQTSVTVATIGSGPNGSNHVKLLDASITKKKKGSNSQPILDYRETLTVPGDLPSALEARANASVQDSVVETIAKEAVLLSRKGGKLTRTFPSTRAAVELSPWNGLRVNPVYFASYDRYVESSTPDMARYKRESAIEQAVRLAPLALLSSQGRSEARQIADIKQDIYDIFKDQLPISIPSVELCSIAPFERTSAGYWHGMITFPISDEVRYQSNGREQRRPIICRARLHSKTADHLDGVMFTSVIELLGKDSFGERSDYLLLNLSQSKDSSKAIKTAPAIRSLLRAKNITYLSQSGLALYSSELKHELQNVNGLYHSINEFHTALRDLSLALGYGQSADRLRAAQRCELLADEVGGYHEQLLKKLFPTEEHEYNFFLGLSSAKNLSLVNRSDCLNIKTVIDQTINRLSTEWGRYLNGSIDHSRTLANTLLPVIHHPAWPELTDRYQKLVEDWGKMDPEWLKHYGTRLSNSQEGRDANS